MSLTEAKPRPSPKVKWRIEIPLAPVGPPTISARTKKWSILTHWFLTVIVTALTAVRFSSPFSLGNGTFVYYGKGGVSMTFWAVLMGVIFFVLSYGIIRVVIFQNLPYIRSARKVYEELLAAHNETVLNICEEAAKPIRKLWFPLCKYEEARPYSFSDVKIWWRTGDEANSFSVQEFYRASFAAGNERLVRFPKCRYIPDPKKPGTAEFDWGSNAVLQDPTLL